ncbi:MAG: PilW family protein [Thermacetogeniaceae bacterium]|nr:prepilin-type N-terminal cleavage/methylation domain-containing protein [Thermoanaerobacterales bacterium]NLN21928.1 type II secretion system protein [Syntrophomonadaceae bacterium]
MREQGFTLVEIIIALTIFAFLFTVIAYIQARGAASYTLTSQQVEVQESLRIALSKMSTELKAASPSTVRISNDGRKISFDNSDGTAGFRYDPYSRELETYINGVWLPFASNIEDVLFQYCPELAVAYITVKGKNGISGTQELTTAVSLRVR